MQILQLLQKYVLFVLTRVRIFLQRHSKVAASVFSIFFLPSVYSKNCLNITLSNPKTWLSQTGFTVPSTEPLVTRKSAKPDRPICLMFMQFENYSVPKGFGLDRFHCICINIYILCFSESVLVLNMHIIFAAGSHSINKKSSGISLDTLTKSLVPQVHFPVRIGREFIKRIFQTWYELHTR